MEIIVASLIALVVVLIIVIVYLMRKKKDSFHNPYALLNSNLDAVRGKRNDGYKQDGLDKYHRSGVSIKPEQLTEAERQQWYATMAEDESAQFNTELAQENFTDTLQYHSKAPAMDYDGYVTDLVVEPRVKDNHKKWAKEMEPWSGGLRQVDDLDMSNYVDYIGLRRPQAVAVYNPTQLTEIGTSDLASNKKFNFQG